MTAARNVYALRARKILSSHTDRIKRREDVLIQMNEMDEHLITALEEQMRGHSYGMLREAPMLGAPVGVLFLAWAGT